jgi:predicted neuraminidase
MMPLNVSFIPRLLCALLLLGHTTLPAQMSGGFATVKTDTPATLSAARAAVSAQAGNLQLKKVESAQAQVVAGFNYRLGLRVLDGTKERRAEAVVWLQLDRTFKVVSWDWLDPAAPEAGPGVVQSEFIYESGPYPQIHATTLCETPGGLVAAWFGGTHEGHRDVCIWVSRQINGRWMESVQAAHGIQPDGSRFPTWNPVLFLPKTGPLFLFYKVGPSPSGWWGEFKTSDDHGLTWKEAKKLPAGFLGPIKNKPVQLSSGEILCPTSVETPEKASRWSVYFERTSDLGETWQKTPLLNDGAAIQAIQPSVLFLGGENLLAIGRSKQGRLFELQSGDGGKNWGPMTLGRLPNNNSGTDALTLRDGRHLLVYNHVAPEPGQRNARRTPLNVAVSKDGNSWDAALELETEQGEFSYPAVIQSQDGLVHISYTWNRRRVKHVVVDPNQFRVQPIVDGRWPGPAR